VTRKGPRRVKIRETLEEAVAQDLFRLDTLKYQRKQEVF